MKVLLLTQKPPGLRERNRIRTRDEILAAMSVLLGERQFENLTIEDVAQHAGVSRGTIYSYFADGRDQLVRDAYLRIADMVAANGASRREQHSDVTDRILALAEALVDIAVTPEGRFYGMMGSSLIGPLSGITGTASSHFKTLLIEDLGYALKAGSISAETSIDDLAVLLGGAIREIGATAAREPDRAEALLDALRKTCDAVLGSAR